MHSHASDAAPGAAAIAAVQQVTKRGRGGAGAPIARRNATVADLVAKQYRIDWL
jgi:hypothetical protein